MRGDGGGGEGAAAAHGGSVRRAGVPRGGLGVGGARGGRGAGGVYLGYDHGALKELSGGGAGWAAAPVPGPPLRSLQPQPRCRPAQRRPRRPRRLPPVEVRAARGGRGGGDVSDPRAGRCYGRGGDLHLLRPRPQRGAACGVRVRRPGGGQGLRAPLRRHAGAAGRRRLVPRGPVLPGGRGEGGAADRGDERPPAAGRVGGGGAGGAPSRVPEGDPRPPFRPAPPRAGGGRGGGLRGVGVGARGP
mmetsp:Transcript_43364/g.138411  ORF Transcript_43364/g.138411 Transcript_43364/m.138411 type:complete len:245 (+) Transcript_43364:604-1338(+)